MTTFYTNLADCMQLFPVLSQISVWTFHSFRQYLYLEHSYPLLALWLLLHQDLYQLKMFWISGSRCVPFLMVLFSYSDWLHEWSVLLNRHIDRWHWCVHAYHLLSVWQSVLLWNWSLWMPLPCQNNLRIETRNQNIRTHLSGIPSHWSISTTYPIRGWWSLSQHLWAKAGAP